MRVGGRGQPLGLLLLLAVAALAAAPQAVQAQSAYCRSLQHKRFIRVSNDRQLSAAINSARPGDLVELQDGQYTRMKVYAKHGSGPSQAQSITFCGSRKAVVIGDAALSVYAVDVQYSSYIRLVGFTAASGLSGEAPGRSCGGSGGSGACACFFCAHAHCAHACPAAAWHASPMQHFCLACMRPMHACPLLRAGPWRLAPAHRSSHTTPACSPLQVSPSKRL